MMDSMLGALLGVSLGDAMGMPVEGWSRERIRSQVGEIRDFLPGQDGNEISAGFLPYETTDDTAVTMLVAQLILETDGSPEPLALVQRIEDWAAREEKSKVVIGPSTRLAFERIHQGIPAEEAGRNGTTNGASMRIAPAGLFCDYRLGDELFRLVEKLCLPTHNTKPAISAACAVAAAVSYAVYGRGDCEEMLSVALSAAEQGETRGYDVCSASVPARIRLAVELSERYGDDGAFMDALYRVVGTGLPSSESVPAALAITYRTDCDLFRSIRMCANTGGDTDTMGAICGAICGARRGAASIPPAVAAALEERNPLPYRRVASEFARHAERIQKGHPC